METSNLTVMFTDMKGFTIRTSSQSREETRRMIERHRDILLPVITRFGGRLIKEIGDAFLAVFESPTDAILAGVALQETLAAHNASASAEDRIEVRIAVNSGEVIMEKGDVYGEAVNIAARVQAHAEPNEIYFTEATYLSMNKPEVRFEELGYRILKGLPHKIKIYKVLKPGEAGQGVSAPSAIVPTWRRACALLLDCLFVSLAVFLLFALPLSQQKHKSRELSVWADSWMAQAGTRLASSAGTAALKKEIEALKSDLAAGRAQAAEKRRELEAAQIDLDEKIRLIDRDDELFSRKSEASASPETDEALIREETELRKRRLALDKTQDGLYARTAAVEAEEEKLSEREAALEAKNEELSLLLEAAEETGDVDPKAVKVMLWGSGPVPEGFPGAQEVEEFRERRAAVEREARNLALAFTAAWALIFLIYHTLFFSSRGRTPGKALFKLRVCREDGRAMGPARSFFRGLCYFVSALPLGFGFFSAKFDVRHRAWQDKLTATKVVFK